MSEHRSALTTVLEEVFRAANNVEDSELPRLLLGVLGGLEGELAASRWDTYGVCQSAKLLARLPEGASMRLIFRSFLSNLEWRQR